MINEASSEYVQKPYLGNQNTLKMWLVHVETKKDQFREKSVYKKSQINIF